MSDTEKVVEMFAESFELNPEDVKEIILTDWCARESFEIRMFGKRESLPVQPFVYNDDGKLVKGNELFQTLYSDYMTAMIKDHDLLDKSQKWMREFFAEPEEEEMNK